MLLGCQPKEDKALPEVSAAAATASAQAVAPTKTASAVEKADLKTEKESDEEEAKAEEEAEPVKQEVSSSITAQIANELGRLNVSTTEEGLRKLGDRRSFLLNTAGSLATSAKTLSVVLNHGTVVNSFMNRPDIDKACEEPNKLRPILLFVLKSSAARAIAKREDAVDAIVKSELTRRFTKCPAFKELSGDPKFLAGAVADDPSLEDVVDSKGVRRGLKELEIEPLDEALVTQLQRAKGKNDASKAEKASSSKDKDKQKSKSKEKQKKKKKE